MASFFNQINTALLGPAGKPPPPAIETIQRITDRLTQSTLISDRRAAVLSLKGLSRDWKAAVGEHSLLALIAVLEVDVKEDPDICKAALETLLVLCEVEEADSTESSKGKAKVAKDDLGLKHTDVVLSVCMVIRYFTHTRMNLTIYKFRHLSPLTHYCTC